MSYNLSQSSLGKLTGVDANLQKVIKRAIELTEQDFMVLQGMRTREECSINYGKGRTAQECTAKGVPAQYAQPNLAKVTWLRDPYGSKHTQGKAVDIVPYPLDWNDLSKYQKIATAMKRAASELNVKVTWGGDWATSKDYPHFEV
ncbi:M15 family metallopeptidase [Acinetobacter brisouii]|uniref:M15 family metallopeptidase n=1 Tax=Acinetobacter brisouii TaxID=396323 RepID=UPI00124E2E0C|nr:M15 family metallopeptidase [Acinetobacter brisouii]